MMMDVDRSVVICTLRVCIVCTAGAGALQVLLGAVTIAIHGTDPRTCYIDVIMQCTHFKDLLKQTDIMCMLTSGASPFQSGKYRDFVRLRLG